MAEPTVGMQFVDRVRIKNPVGDHYTDISVDADGVLWGSDDGGPLYLLARVVVSTSPPSGSPPPGTIWVQY